MPRSQCPSHTRTLPTHRGILVNTQRFRVVAVLAAVFATCLGIVAPAPAEPTTGTDCVIILGRAAPGQVASIRSQACQREDNFPAVATAAQRKVLLMEWFENANNRPPSLTRVYGEDGQCDGDGYRIRVHGGWDGIISGFNSYNNCNIATGYDTYNISGDRQTWELHKPCNCLLVDWVGDYMNDRISSFWIRSG